jgi:hypothetical protein
MAVQARKFETEEEAWEFITRVGDTSEARVAAGPYWDWDSEVAPELEALAKAKAKPEVDPVVAEAMAAAKARVAKNPGKLEAAFAEMPAGRPGTVEPEPVEDPQDDPPEPEELPSAEPEPAEPLKEAARAEPEEAVEPSKALVIIRPQMPVPSPDVETALREMNDRHALIRNYGGKTVIMSWEPSQVNPRWQVPVFQAKESFLLQYCNVRIQGQYGLMKLGQMWLDWPQRRTYFGVTFLPGGPKEVGGRINIWQGWGVTARPGNWGLIKDHIFTVLAGGDAECADYVIRWLAWSVQTPAKQAKVALVLIGEKAPERERWRGALNRCPGLICSKLRAKNMSSVGSTTISMIVCCSSRTRHIGAAIRNASVGCKG